MEKPEGQRINLELGENEAEGIYSNFAVITHSPSEFIIDFARILPGVPKAKVYARIVMSPHNAKLLKRTLEDNIKKFEDKFGEVKTPGGPQQTSKPIGFSASQPKKKEE